MDWPLANAGLSDSDLARVFRYSPQETTVVRRLTTDPEPVIWSHSTSEDWETWFQQSVPSIEKDSGLVLILARKSGEAKGTVPQVLAGAASFGSSRANTGFQNSFNEKDRSYSWPKKEKLSTGQIAGGEGPSAGPLNQRGGSQEVRRLPFDKETFSQVCKKFFIHGSIARVISRADISIFSRAKVEMGPMDSDGRRQSAFVYSCRSANTWKNDLALSVTYFPRTRLMFGILFGCTAAMERQVLNRIAGIEALAFHPLLLPGIFAELERTRMVDVVEATIDEIEGAIFELDNHHGSQGTSSEDPEYGHVGGVGYVRRTVWLNTTFLRNRLQIWKLQLIKMVAHVDELSETDRGSSSELFYVHSGDGHEQGLARANDDAMRQTGMMIKDRLKTLIEEFEEKIEECSMRVDGMTIATQWSQADTNVDIATSTKRDSSQMRSIALVTMVFLPGTFFATLFSMTFFNWNSPGENGIVVSSYIWIYFLITGVFTIATLFMWWYFLVHRRARARYSTSKGEQGTEDV